MISKFRAAMRRIASRVFWGAGSSRGKTGRSTPAPRDPRLAELIQEYRERLIGKHNPTLYNHFLDLTKRAADLREEMGIALEIGNKEEIERVQKERNRILNEYSETLKLFKKK